MSHRSGFQMGDDTIPDRYDLHMWQFMEPQVHALVDKAAIAPNERVLDVACGTGFVARTALERGAGHVVGTDLNPAMLATARRRSEQITWIECPGDDLPFEGREFDVAICSQGLQFFPEPTGGLREMARVSSRLALTVWAERSHVPWFDAHIPMLTEACGVDPAMMNMSFSTEDAVRAWFVESGLSPNIEILETTAVLPAGFSIDYLSALPWGQPFFELEPDERRAVLADVDERLRVYARTNGDLEVPFRALLITTTTEAGSPRAPT